jgi:hypothetical protein
VSLYWCVERKASFAELHLAHIIQAWASAVPPFKQLLFSVGGR